MRFVPVKSERQRAVLMQHRVRDLSRGLLTQLAKAVRAHLGEFGIVEGVHHMARLIAEAEAADLPLEAGMPLDLLVGQFRDRRLRGLLYEAAAALLTKASTETKNRLKAWSLQLRQRLGFKCAAVAVARKLAVIMHTMLRMGERFGPLAGSTA